VTCAYPIETLLAATPDAHGPGDRSWGLYAGLTQLVDAESNASCGHPDVTLGELRGPLGGVVTATNHSDRAVAATIRLPDGARDAAAVGPDGTSNVQGADGDAALDLGAYGAAVVAWRR
jgi:hypothetical protein